jgi:hypothetical protein
MKLVTFLKDGHDQLGIVVDGKIYAMEELHRDLPATMSMFLNYWDELMPMAKAVEQKVKDGLVRNEWEHCLPMQNYLPLYLIQPVAGMDMLSGSMLLQQGVTVKWI